MKKLLKIVLIIFAIVILIGGGVMFYLNKGLKEGKNVSISNINLSNINDGIYKGEYSSGRFSNKIEVKIKNNQITEIKILDDVTFAQEEVANELIEKVIKNQKVNIDVISGATVTSKAYLKSIEEALKN